MGFPINCVKASVSLEVSGEGMYGLKMCGVLPPFVHMPSW
jgi:hypothetical protein